MGLQFKGYIDLPAHLKLGGFDHAAVHLRRHLVYVAHTSNDAVDVIDCEAEKYLYSIMRLPGVAGALVAEEQDLVFTSNRGEDQVGIFAVGERQQVTKVKVGVRPNGLAFDPKRMTLLAANVGNPDVAGSSTLSIVNVADHRLRGSIAVAGRTRWAIYDTQADAFYVNIAEPPQIVIVDAKEPTGVSGVYDVPAAGPHGLDLDIANRVLFCACDGAELVVLAADTGRVLRHIGLSGAPDVIFLNPALNHLYVAIGNPGVIDVIDTSKMKKAETIQTETGAHTLAFESSRNRVYGFLPQTHRAAVFVDSA